MTPPGGAALAAFGMASLVLAATPGPGVLYVVTRTLAQGRRAGFASVAGVALGNFGNALAASLGLAALLAVSGLAFEIVRFAGAAYLVWLGVQALLPARLAGDAAVASVPAPRRVVRDGFIVALLNPKTTLFFAAFLPQFIDPDGPAAAQSAGLGLAFVAIAAGTDSVYVLVAARLAPALRRSGRTRPWGRWLVAATYLGLGIWAAFGFARQVR
jgi:threonine/homoserine/homoserine lactone efflux protein